MDLSDQTELPEDVAAVFASFPDEIRPKLLSLRKLILETASEMEEVGPLEEGLRWGEPSYLTTASRSGTTIRISTVRGEARKYAMYVNCQTTLVDTYRQIYPDLFEFAGTRAVIFDVDKSLPKDAVQHLIALALRYKLDRKENRRNH